MIRKKKKLCLSDNSKETILCDFIKIAGSCDIKNVHIFVNKRTLYYTYNSKYVIVYYIYYYTIIILESCHLVIS